MRDARWDDPHHIPISIGPMRQTTPSVPTTMIGHEGQIIEFVVPYPMHIVDEAEWPELPFSIGNRSLAILKPIVVLQPPQTAYGFGNELPDLPFSTLRVALNGLEADGYPGVDSVWPVIECLLTWIRVKARHYWLLHGTAGFGALYRGTNLKQSGSQVGQSNFSTYGQTVIVKPLSVEIWSTLADEISGLSEPPVSDSIYCDAMISIVGGDEIKAILELGVACEIEISSLLDELSASDPLSQASKEYTQSLARNYWRDLSFRRKVGAWPQKFGLPPASSFKLSWTPSSWEADINELYDFRGSVAHSGRFRQGKQVKNTATYLFAANALFEYCREQRRSRSIATYAVPVTQPPSSQILAYIKGRMFGQTNFTSIRV